MVNKPKISIIVPTFNRAEYLAECLDSLLEQTVKPYQVIVINNGSTDDTVKVLDLYKGKIEYYEIVQKGKSVAINYGLTFVKGDYVWIFDDDDVAFPDTLERLVTPLEQNPDYGFSYGTFYFTQSADNGRIGKIVSEMEYPDLQSRGFLIPLFEWNILGGAALFARTACYKKLGMFNPDLIRSQDYEMAIRIVRAFKGVRISGGALFHYRQHSGDRGSIADRFKINQRSQKWLAYDQMFFNDLYVQLPLDDYLPPGCPLSDHKRQALLQRLAIMAYKCLDERVLRDLNELKLLNDQSRLTDVEYGIVWDMLFMTYYPEATRLFDRPYFFKEICCLAKDSLGLRQLRRKIVKIIFRRVTKVFSVSDFLKSINRTWNLYIG